jgi:hypothetical protein
LAKGISTRLTPAEGRRFAFTVGGAFLVLSLIMWWRGHESVLMVTSTASGLLILAGLLIPGRLGPVYAGWMKFGLAISKVTTPIIMGAMFYLVITPFGLVKRMFSRSSVARQPRTAPSYWAERPVGARRGDLKRQF